MVEVNDIKSSLDENKFLTDDIKDNIMELITIFKDEFPGVNLTNTVERLKTLKIKKGSKYLIKSSSKYDPITNEILISKSKLDLIDSKHILMRELLNLITAKDNYTGFNNDNLYEALNIGYTELIVNALVGNEEMCEYEDEIIEANLMANIIGLDIVNEAYFNNDVNIILKAVS